MREINDLREIQQIEFEILKKFDEFCQENNLRYFLDYGSLLGAVRFKGFIPWDDDIDVSMPRPDYEKFLNLTKGKLSETYSVISPQFSKHYNYPFIKIIDNRTIIEESGTKNKYEIGLFIDVFPIDGVPNDKNRVNEHIKKIDMLLVNLFRVKCDYKGRTVLRTIGRTILSKIIPVHRIIKMIEKEAKKYSFEDSDYVAVTVWGGGHSRGVIVKKDDYLSPLKFTFEGKEFVCPGIYNEYLKDLYGVYTKLPPKEKQVSHHSFKVYMK